MEAKRSHSSTTLPDMLAQLESAQQPSNSHQHPSQSSQTCTGAPSSTGQGASVQSMTATTANFDPVPHQAVLDHQYGRVSSPDQHHDLSHIGSWDTTIKPFDNTFTIENESLLSPNYRSGTAVNAANAGNGFYGPVAEGGATKEKVVGLLRASLHRKV